VVRPQEASGPTALLPTWGRSNLTIRDVVPVRGKELKVAQLNDVKELILVPVWAAERREATQEYVEDHTCSPHVHLQAITYINTGRDTKEPQTRQHQVCGEL
jgi:hypothetical protein